MFRKRWVRRLVYTLTAALVIIGVASVWWNRNATQHAGEENLEAILAELDRTDPRWRWDDLVADRMPVADDRNGALLLPKFLDALELLAERYPNRAISPRRDDGSDPFDTILPNRHLTDEDYARVESVLEGTKVAGEVALAFKDRPTGIRKFDFIPNYLSILNPEFRGAEEVSNWIFLDAERQSRNGQMSSALVRCRAELNVGRSVATEPIMIGQFLRMVFANKAIKRTERTLALGSSDIGLTELQAAFQEESLVDRFRIAMRGERAGKDLIFQSIASGQCRLTDVKGDDKPELEVVHSFSEWAYKKWLNSDRAHFLQSLTRAIEITSLPDHQQRRAMAELRFVPEESEFVLSRAMLSLTKRNHESEFYWRARLRCAVAGLAVERFRLAKGRWPTTLDEIPRDILAVVPLDPYDGNPLKYVRRSDGVTVYSIGPDEQDDGGQIPKQLRKHLPGQDVGFRLFDVDQRGLPALPAEKQGE